MKAKALWDRFDFVDTPKHGSWLNMAETELNVLIVQCLNRRIDNVKDVKKETQPGKSLETIRTLRLTGNLPLPMLGSSSRALIRR